MNKWFRRKMRRDVNKKAVLERKSFRVPLLTFEKSLFSTVNLFQRIDGAACRVDQARGESLIW
jgi:hypothetical protein